MLPEFNPPWSQPICWRCYKKRYGVKCKVFASWTRDEKCHDCGKPTKQGIYFDPRPRPRGRGRHTYTKKELAAWEIELRELKRRGY